MQRRAVFETKLNEIVMHNTRVNSTFYKGINEYSDLTDEEFADYFHLIGDNQECSATHASVFGKDVTYPDDLLKDIPAHWDWRDLGIVSPVKNQAKCGSCWTFSTVGAMESHFIKRYGSFMNLSE